MKKQKPTNKRFIVSASVDEKTYAYFVAFCDMRERSMSEVIVELIKNSIKLEEK